MRREGEEVLSYDSGQPVIWADLVREGFTDRHAARYMGVSAPVAQAEMTKAREQLQGSGALHSNFTRHRKD